MRPFIRFLSVFGAALLAVVGVLVAPAPAAHAAENRVVCNHAWVRVRAAATTTSKELGRLARGTQVTGTRQGSWLRLADGRFVAAYYTCPAGSSGQQQPTATALLQPTGTLGSPTTPFGQRFHPILRTWRLHNGIDIGNRAAEPIRAAEAGVVTTIARDATAGLHVRLEHGSVAGTPRVGTGYLHMASTTVAHGQRVERGQVIGHVGNTGLSTKPHLHFLVYESGTPVNPEKYLGPLSSLRA